MPYQLVLLRHGESTWNLENRFSGWTDVDLTATGEREARAAGELLCDAGFQFDRAFTSVLVRAIRTLWIALDVLEQVWIPVARAWQLNERHYGALQGLNKAEMTAELGQEQVQTWRRSFTGTPPALAPDDPRHPRFDRRYARVPPERLPATESLADTLARVRPIWQTVIAPRVRAGEQVLIVAHGNSLRALLKDLDDITDEAIPRLYVPTGFPLVLTLDTSDAPGGALRVVEQHYLGDSAAVQAAAAAQQRRIIERGAE